MTVKEFAEQLNMRILSGENSTDKEVSGVYAGDLLSWVMSHADRGNAWITVLTNINTVAVALLTEVSCIIIPEGIMVEDATIKRANMEGVVILGSDMDAYEICWKAHRLMQEGL